MSDGRSYAVEGNDLTGYIGVDPEYMTYAEETHRPFLTQNEIDEEVGKGNLEYVEVFTPHVDAPVDVEDVAAPEQQPQDETKDSEPAVDSGEGDDFVTL